MWKKFELVFLETEWQNVRDFTNEMPGLPVAEHLCCMSYLPLL